MRWLFILALVSSVACGRHAPVLDRDAGPLRDGCAPVACTLFCEWGFATDPSGCLVCACNPAPSETCTRDEDCVLGFDLADCCSCPAGFTPELAARDRCVVLPGEEDPPTDCRDITACAGIACRCVNATRAVCTGGSCAVVDTCPEGQIPGLYRCDSACMAHTDCTLAADYSSCCGGCGPYHVSVVEEMRCLAPSQREAMCSPPAEVCAELDCVMPPSDCTLGDGSAVCMSDGRCEYGGPMHACPSGSEEMGGVCVRM